MASRRGHDRSARPTASVVYALGMLALLAVSLLLRGGETAPERWALISVPVALVASASLLMRSSQGR